MQLKILSWNIWCDCDFSKVCDFLRTSNADIIGLQEIVPGDTGRDVVALLSKLGYEHAVAPIGGTLKDGRMITVGVFSRYPVQSSKTHTLSEESGRQAVEADVTIGDEILSVFSVHLKHSHQQADPTQNIQTENLLKVIPKKKGIVMGDFNATPEMIPIKRMRDILVDANPTSSPTLNASFDCSNCDMALIPQTCLDYIFLSKDLKFNSFKVETDAQGSDHLPVSVIVEI